ncbi:hypothetical protein CK203_006669 [Vitis vinifera]|uniref:Uncharacterized protein n=1 Tax=Vitis vinifera TaxID=29760 RepID=A0A438KB78_VITVI|nr:hypothetical protein CK203_006669 [Vitis vinifera]
MDDLFGVRANTQCSKMTCEQPPSKSWLPDKHPEVVRKEVPNFRPAKVSDRRQEGPSRPEMPPLTPLSISYEKLLPMIQDMSDFRWPRPLRTDPSKGIIVKNVSTIRSMVTQRDMQVPPLFG